MAGVEIGSVSSWLTAGGVVALIGVVLGFIIKMRAADIKGWGELIQALQADVANVRAEIVVLRQAVRECQERELEWHRRAIDAEAKLQNEGRLKQELAKMQAADRGDPDKAPTTAERFGGDKGEGK